MTPALAATAESADRVQGDVAGGQAARPAYQAGQPIPSAPAAWGTRAIRAAIGTRPVRHGIALLTRVLPPPRVQLTHYELRVPRLPAGCDGLRVLHLSDLHLHRSGHIARQVPALVAGVPHDLLVYTGDFIDTDDDIPQLAALLAQMPRRAPAFAVLGNHDYTPFGRAQGANDVGRLRAVLAASGIAVLTNSARRLYGGQLIVAGVDDPATDQDDLAATLASVSAQSCCLLLAHSPDVLLRLRGHRPSLVLAGHTHGGQIRLPGIGALLTMSRMPRGLAMGAGMYDGVPLFVTRGIGYSALDIRLGCPPEAALLTLRPSDIGGGRRTAHAVRGAPMRTGTHAGS
jgi:predicted MPP superfamily phosphohydrolase